MKKQSEITIDSFNSVYANFLQLKKIFCCKGKSTKQEIIREILAEVENRLILAKSILEKDKKTKLSGGGAVCVEK